MLRLASFTARELKNCKQGNKRGVSVCPGSLRGGEERREPCVAQRPPGSRAAVTVTVTIPRAWKKEGHRRGQRVFSTPENVTARGPGVRSPRCCAAWGSAGPSQSTVSGNSPKSQTMPAVPGKARPGLLSFMF